MIDDVNDLDVIIRPSKWGFNDKGEYRTKDIEYKKSLKRNKDRDVWDY